LAFESLRNTARELGWGLTLAYALHRLLQAAGIGRVVPYAFVAQPVGAGAYAQLRDDPKTLVRHAAPGDPLEASFPRPREVNRARWASGARCHVCTVGGEFAGTIWIQRQRYEEDEVRCDYVIAQPDRCVWDFDVVVAPKYRLGRTMGRLWKAVDAELARDGVRWTLSRISLFNPASLRSHTRLGAVPVGWASFLVIGPMQLAISSAAPRVHVSLRGGTRPSYLIHAPQGPGHAAQAPDTAPT
jgi:hypothetical protein